MRRPDVIPDSLHLGRDLNDRVAPADQQRQRKEIAEILRRLEKQPGVILADEVGMGKTFVALGVAYAVARSSPVGPVIVMAPPSLVTKWEKDLKAFFELYVPGVALVRHDDALHAKTNGPDVVRYGVARHSVELMRLLDDPQRTRCGIILLAQGAMSRRQADKWVRLALIAEALRKHGVGRAARLIKVKQQIHRFLGKLISAVGEERMHDLGDELWQRLLRQDPSSWGALLSQGGARVLDDPVPKAVVRALKRDVDLKSLAKALEEMPLRAVGTDARVNERIQSVRDSLRQAEQELWKDMLVKISWRSPLLILDEAHHLKNSDAGPARQLREWDGTTAQRTGDGAMAKAFDRMLFLTATPFQLGHHELVNVLRRFADVRLHRDAPFERPALHEAFARLEAALTECQRATLRFQRTWTRLLPPRDVSTEMWWREVQNSPLDEMPPVERAAVQAFRAALDAKDAAECLLRPWVIRHNKGRTWANTSIVRRERNEGARFVEAGATGGLAVPSSQLLPFYLAARSAANPTKDLLSEALSSSYEAFRETRKRGEAHKDRELDESADEGFERPVHWYLDEFDRALQTASGALHPKVNATVRRVVGLWEAGEKVVVFAFYRYTCRALRIHISRAIEGRLVSSVVSHLGLPDSGGSRDEASRILTRVQDRFFDRLGSRGRRALDDRLGAILDAAAREVSRAERAVQLHHDIMDVMRRFLRATSSVARSFPVQRTDDDDVAGVVEEMLLHQDRSGASWAGKFESFLRFLLKDCTADEQVDLLAALSGVSVGGVRVEDERESEGGILTLPNIQSATGETRRETRERLMRTFNTPFFPEILVCSQVMGEGVDLQRYCRHVIHHDLDWNPSTLEQRTGRIDRLSCKAESRSAVVADLPYVAGASDERQFKVMSERERWFRVVMGQDVVNELITADTELAAPLPEPVAEALSFNLALPEGDGRGSEVLRG